MKCLLLLAVAIAALAQPTIGEWRVLEGFESRSLAAARSRGAPGERVHQHGDAGPGTHFQALYAAARRLTEAEEEPAGGAGTEATGADAGTGTGEATGTGATDGGGTAEPPENDDDDNDATGVATPPDTDTPPAGGDTNTTTPTPPEEDTTGVDPDMPDPVDEPDGVPIAFLVLDLITLASCVTHRPASRLCGAMPALTCAEFCAFMHMYLPMSLTSCSPVTSRSILCVQRSVWLFCTSRFDVTLHVDLRTTCI